MIGSLGLIAIAVADFPLVFVGLFLFLTFTDWIDGKLAIWLHQRTKLGARLDSAADAAMYGAVLFGATWLKGDVLLAEWAWITAALTTYVASHLASYIKFRRLASYHTRAAKTSAFFALLAVVGLFLGWSSWPMRVAMAAVTLTNLEAIAITWMLRQWRTDVLSIWHAARSRDKSEKHVWNSA